MEYENVKNLYLVERKNIKNKLSTWMTIPYSPFSFYFLLPSPSNESARKRYLCFIKVLNGRFKKKLKKMNVYLI